MPVRVRKIAQFFAGGMVWPGLDGLGRAKLTRNNNSLGHDPLKSSGLYNLGMDQFEQK